MNTTKLKGAFGDDANAPENSETHFPHRRLHCGLCLERPVRCLHSHSGAGLPGSWKQNRVVSDNDANASEGTHRYPRASTRFKKTQSGMDVSNRGTVEDLLLHKQSLFCYWQSWRELTQCSEEYRKQAVTLHQLILRYRFSTSQSIHTSFRQSAGPICAASLR
jgi:hypothetical protein